MCFSPPLLPRSPLFAGYINAHRLYFMPHDSDICTLAAVWRDSNVSQKPTKPTTMTDSNFQIDVLYLCAMIHTVADCFLLCSAFSTNGLGKHFSLSLCLHPESFSSYEQLYVTSKLCFVTVLQRR